MQQLAKILLTIAAIQYGAVPLSVDLSASHVFNHDWPPHARFHMVWLLAVGGGLAAYVLSLVWWPVKGAGNDQRNEHEDRLKHASIIGAILLLGFFAAALTLKNYGGALSDPEHQILIFGIDGNLISFSIAALFQATAILILWCASQQKI